MSAHTNRSVATRRHKRDTVLKSTGEDRRGTLLPCRTYSTHGRKYKTRGRPCGASSRRAGSGCGGRMDRDSSLPQARDPRQRTIWRGQPRAAAGFTLFPERFKISIRHSLGFGIGRLCRIRHSRHTFASRLVMAGVDLRTVQELMGHKTIAMTCRYAHLGSSHKLAAVDRLTANPTQLENSTDTTKKPAILRRVATKRLACSKYSKMQSLHSSARAKLADARDLKSTERMK